MTFNKKHPELRKGEVFLTNADPEGFASVGWTTKRKGMTAYDIHGKPVKTFSEFFPVFVQRAELEKGGIDPDKL